MSRASPRPVVTIWPIGLSWVKGVEDDPADVCAHAHVDVRIGEEVLASPSAGPQVTVSAAALYLMRTLQRPHSNRTPVGDHLFPCCGFAMFDEPGREDVLILGCPSGIDFEVAHEGGDVIIRATGDHAWRIPLAEWQTAVFEFADQVSGFYAASSTKTPAAEDEPGFRKFAAEWRRRRGKPLI